MPQTYSASRATVKEKNEATHNLQSQGDAAGNALKNIAFFLESNCSTFKQLSS
jgi:hypothetical protein